MKEKIWNLTEKNFGPLWPFIIDDAITDIDWDCDSLWLKYADGHIVKADVEIEQSFIDNFTKYVANHESKPFNDTNNTLTAETDTLRITIVHKSFAASGTCFSIRKSLPKLRFTATEALQNGYCPKEALAFLVNSVKAMMNFAFCGEPGHGKTECAKFCSSFITAEEKVITIEDVLEWHYNEIAPEKRCIALKVDSDEDYIMAIKTALRLNPAWIMLSEARSREVRYLLESWSTGVRGMTTLHTNDVRNIPDRIVNMYQDTENKDALINNVFTFLNIGVLLSESIDENGRKSRRIKQICIYYRENGTNKHHMIMDNFELLQGDIPKAIKDIYDRKGIENPFESQDLEQRLIDDISYLEEERQKKEEAERKKEEALLKAQETEDEINNNETLTEGVEENE